MSPSLSFLTSRLAAKTATSRLDHLRLALLVSMHLAALGLMYWSEGDLVSNAVFLLSWGLLNCFWLAVLRRPVVSAALSLGLIVLIVLLSRLKFSIIWMTAN